jgi:hypothetical protein
VRSVFLVALAAVLWSSPAVARPPKSEPSVYGKFAVIYTESACAVSFALAGGKPRVLFTVPDCRESDAAPLTGADSAGGAGLPLTAESGEELHVFSIPAARGGNAVAGNDYWVVVVKRKGASAKVPFYSTGIDSLAASSTRRAVFTLEQQATTTVEGLRWIVSFTGVRKTRIPRIPSTMVSRATRTYAGDLGGGSRVTGARPALRVGDEVVVIHEDGKCKLPKLGEEAGRVELEAEVTRWSDGREVLRCLAVRKGGAGRTSP